MKRIKKYRFLIGSVVLAVVIFAACKKDYLEKVPLGTLNPDLVANEAGVQGILIGAYSLLDGNGSAGDGNYGSAASNWGYGGVASDDAYKGSDPSDVADFAPFEQFGTSLTAVNGAVPQKWNLCYNGIQRSNDVIKTVATVADIKDTVRTRIVA